MKLAEKKKRGYFYYLMVFLALLACSTGTSTSFKGCSRNDCDQDFDRYFKKSPYCYSRTGVYDCDDNNILIYPGAAEICDGLDNNCDGIVPEDETTDLDGDGYPLCADCDDGNPLVYYGAPEVCDGLDNNCDGIVPDNEIDQDGDGYSGCLDCNDADSQVYPGADEICDGVDSNCDGVVGDNEIDLDGDGYLACEDCDDANGDIYPGASEICDGIDDDCDGMVPEEETRDLNQNGIPYCNDPNDFLLSATVVIHPCSINKNPGKFSALVYLGVGFNAGTIIECYANSIPASSISSLSPTHTLCEFDRNAVATDTTLFEVWGITSEGLHFYGTGETYLVDQDGDGYLACEDCDDADSEVYPGAEELCNGLDDNCDGVVPEVETRDLNKNGLVYCEDYNDSLLEVSVRIEPEAFNPNLGKFTAFVSLPLGFDPTAVSECNASNESSYASAYEINYDLEKNIVICKFNRYELAISNTLIEVWGSISNGPFFYGSDTIKKIIE